MDGGTTIGLRLDGKRSLQQFQSLLHADEAKPSARLCRFPVKAHAGIPHSEMNLVRSSPQLHFEVPYPTVLCGIVEGFLEHPVEAKRNVRRHGAWQIVALEVNLYFLYLAEFSTEASHGHSKAQIFQF